MEGWEESRWRLGVSKVEVRGSKRVEFGRNKWWRFGG